MDSLIIATTSSTTTKVPITVQTNIPPPAPPPIHPSWLFIIKSLWLTGVFLWFCLLQRTTCSQIHFATVAGQCARVLPATATRRFIGLLHHGCGQKLLPAVVTAKVECLSIAFSVERGGFVHGHAADGVFGVNSCFGHFFPFLIVVVCRQRDGPVDYALRVSVNVALRRTIRTGAFHTSTGHSAGVCDLHLHLLHVFHVVVHL